MQERVDFDVADAGWRAFVAIALCGALGSAGASADAQHVLTIQASSSVGTATMSVPIGQCSWNAAQRSWNWTIAQPRDLIDRTSGLVVATIRSATLAVRGHSRYEVNFLADAGADTTTFTVTTTPVAFATIPASQAVARAHARFTLTDLNGDGAWLRGTGAPGTGVFAARLNPADGSPDVFASLIGFVYCGPGGSGYGQQDDPSSGYRSANEAVDSIDVRSAFSLTAGDEVLVDTLFDVNPDPDSCIGDLNLDGQIGLVDLGIQLTHFGETVGPSQGDLDGNGVVDLGDLGQLLTAFGGACL